MNIFQSLDLLFPCGENRIFGEVVAINLDIGNLMISEKRKSVHVNASVNAFHMHRSLVRQFREHVDAQELTFADERAIKRLIVLCVLNSYLANYKDSIQYSDYSLVAPEQHSPVRESWSAWWVCGPLDWREVGDWTQQSLQTVVTNAVRSHT